MKFDRNPLNSCNFILFQNAIEMFKIQFKLLVGKKGNKNDKNAFRLFANAKQNENNHFALQE